MKLFVVVASLFLASTCSAGYGAVSTQYHNQDALGQYSYGYSDPNSQKHESRSANGVTHGGYSYVDGHGHVQSVKYVSDPIHGFQVAGTNLPQGPAPVHHAHAHLAYAAPVVHAQHIAYAAPLAYAAPWSHHSAPLALHHGVPVDTPEVQHAKAEHFAAHAAARSGLHHVHRRSAWGYSAPWAHAAPAIHNGVPVDTPEVQHAKAEHFAAHSQALAQQHVASAHLGYAPAAHHNGAPVDTPEVQHAKAAHFAAHAAARSGAAHYAPSHYAPAHYAPAHYAQHVPVIHNGVPVDTPEVQHAKAAHFAAVAEANHRSYSAPASAHAYAGHAYGAQHVPVIHNGVPVDTPEVQHAKAAHFAAVAQASAHSWDNGHHDDGHWDNGHDNGHWDNGHGHHDW